MDKKKEIQIQNRRRRPFLIIIIASEFIPRHEEQHDNTYKKNLHNKNGKCDHRSFFFLKRKIDYQLLIHSMLSNIENINRHLFVVLVIFIFSCDLPCFIQLKLISSKVVYMYI